MSDCPECEYCCLIGLCCPADVQQTALVAFFVKGGSTHEEAERHAAMIVTAKLKAQKS